MAVPTKAWRRRVFKLSSCFSATRKKTVLSTKSLIRLMRQDISLITVVAKEMLNCKIILFEKNQVLILEISSLWEISCYSNFARKLYWKG